MIPPQLTVEQLALEVGLPASTIRMYQTKGLLHPPQRHGRSARYNGSHVERLRLVQRLQARGFSLPAIAELVAAHAGGRSVAEVLGLGREATAADEWVPVTVRELRTLLPARDLRLALVRRSARLGLLRWRRGRPYTRRWALQSGLRLAELAVPREHVLDQYAMVRTATDEIAAGFVETFERHVWPALTAGADHSDTLDRARDALAALSETAEATLLGALRESMRGAADAFARTHDLLPRDGEPEPWPVAEPADDARDLESTVDDKTVENFLADAGETGR